MSSSNRVRLAVIPETVYGETPVAGNFQEARYTSESLSGTPTTTESQTIRSDRQSSGQIVTGLEVTGDISIEMAKETLVDSFLESAMMNTWNVLPAISVTADIVGATKKITRASGSFITDGLVKGDFVTIAGATETENNVLAAVKAVTALELDLITQFAMEDETAATLTITRADKLTVGTTKKSFSMEKSFLDLTTKAINYRGMIVDTLSLEAAYGATMTGTFTFMGNDYKAVDAAADMMTNTRTITAPATAPFLNGSIDMPIIAASATTGVLDSDDLCIQSVGIELSNNNAALTCIGKAAPENYSEGTARAAISMSTYLKNESWSFLPKKLTQEPFEFLFAVKNQGGGYGFYLPAIQVSSDDPQSAGLDQQVSLELEGQGKIGPNGESEISIFKLA